MLQRVCRYERTYPVENGVITSTSYASPKSPTYATQVRHAADNDVCRPFQASLTTTTVDML